MVQMLGKYIMIKELPLEEISKSGLITNFMKGGQAVRGDGPFKGEVISVPVLQKENIPVGSTVLYEAYRGGYDVSLEGEDYFITKLENIWAVLE